MRRLPIFSTAIVLGCASAPKPPAPRVPAVPSPPLEDATDVVQTYEHEGVEPKGGLPAVGGYVRVRAPLAVAYAVATRFGEYADLDSELIEQTTVVDRRPDLDATDVYVKVPTVSRDYVWAVVRFRPVHEGPGYAFRGDEVKGNLDELRIFWRVVASGERETVAQLELFADPHLRLPRAWILPELREGVRIILDRYRQKT